MRLRQKALPLHQRLAAALPEHWPAARPSPHQAGLPRPGGLCLVTLAPGLSHTGPFPCLCRSLSIRYPPPPLEALSWEASATSTPTAGGHPAPPCSHSPPGGGGACPVLPDSLLAGTVASAAAPSPRRCCSLAGFSFASWLWAWPTVGTQ